MNVFRWIFNFIFPSRSDVSSSPLDLNFEPLEQSILSNYQFPLLLPPRSSINNLLEPIHIPQTILLPPTNYDLDRPSTVNHVFNLTEYLRPELREILPRHDIFSQNMHELFRRNMADTHDEADADVFDENFHYPQPTTQPQSSRPASGVNSDKLERIQAARKKRKQTELVIPAEFNCAISGCVMTNPVHTEKTPQIYFEREQLVYWLEQNPIHPHTRQPLTSEELILDEDLQEEINTFIGQYEIKSVKRRISQREESELKEAAKSFLKLKTTEEEGRQKKRACRR